MKKLNKIAKIDNPKEQLEKELKLLNIIVRLDEPTSGKIVYNS